MKDIFQEFKEQLVALEISDEKKAELLESYGQIDKSFTRLDFLHRRSMKDKAITINILKMTAQELQSQKDSVLTINDQLTQQKLQLEEQSQQLAKNLHALQMSYSELEQFAYIASHDLKSPLRNIGSYAQLLKKRYYNALDNEANQFIDFIVNNAQLMNNVISDLLEYNTIESKKELVQTNFSNIVDLIRFNLRDVILQNSAEFEIENLPTLWAHKTGTIQLIQNLIDNAIKYRSTKTPHIKITAQQVKDSNLWQFSISDNGVGLDEIYKEKAFHPFQRINQRDRPGSGMGLAICRKVVKLHGGDIWFTKNSEGGGTTFHFTIPQWETNEVSYDKPMKDMRA
jgi:light-regulated signal transduction histidine kinase (bacteriophytochrome)